MEFERVRDSFQSYRSDNWAQVIIEHGNAFTTEQIIDEIVEKLVNSTAFFPCYHKRYAKKDEFFLCRNFDALYQLMIVNLEHQILPNMPKIAFTLRLNAAKFNNTHVDCFNKINYVLMRRTKNNVLDINEFASDPDFSKIIVPMNSKYTLNFIVDYLRKHCKCSKITAQNNKIKSLEGLSNLHTLPKLETLDLRNNNIFTLDGVSQTSSVIELMLDGNPICEKFQSPQAYVSEVCKYFTHIEWLDGHRIDSVVETATLQNFLVTRDAYTIGEEFVKTFFTVYDSFERERLLQIYQHKAIFTMSSYFNMDRVVGQQKNTFYRNQKYTKFSRNLHVMSNLTQACDKVVVGINNIGHVFNELSKSSHDIKSFCIDVPLYDPNLMVIINVSGVFKEEAETLNGSSFLLGFTRTFVLIPSGGGAYNIVNDQLFVHDPPLATTSGNHSRSENNFENKYRDLMPTDDEEKKTKLMLFQNLTELKKDECVRQLEESFWDFKVALATFNTMMDSNDIADSKFDFK